MPKAGQSWLDLLGSQEAVDLRNSKFSKSMLASKDNRAENTKRIHTGRKFTASHIQNLSLSHLGKVPSNKGKQSPLKGKTYAEIGRSPVSPLAGIARKEQDCEKIKAGLRKFWGPASPDSERDTVQYKEWRSAVLKRDSYTCQHCFVKQNDIIAEKNNNTKVLHAHHIKSWIRFVAFRYDVDNGLTLCAKCHRQEDARLQKEEKRCLVEGLLCASSKANIA